MKIRLYDLFIDMIIIIGVGIPLVFIWTLDTWRTVLTLMILLFLVVYLVTHGIKKNTSNGFLRFYLIIFAGILIFETVKGIKLYNYSFNEVFYALRLYIWLLFSIPLFGELLKADYYDKYIKKFVNITLISLGIRTVTWFFNNYLKISIFYNLAHEYGNVWERAGKLRIDATALIGVLIPLLFYLYKKYKNKKYLGYLLISFGYVCIVSQTRTLSIGVFACIVAMLFFEKRSLSKKLIIQLGIFAIILIVLNTGALDYIMASMNISLTDGSIGYRQYEFNYYASLLSDSKWITGLGVLTSKNGNARRLLFGDLSTQMYIDDLGMFESILQFGVLAIALYLILIIYIIYIIYKCNKFGEHAYSVYLIGQLIYICIVSIPLNLFGIQRIFSVSLILAITCSIDNKIKNKIENEKSKIII